jgi:Transposase, Mutator family
MGHHPASGASRQTPPCRICTGVSTLLLGSQIPVDLKLDHVGLEVDAARPAVEAVGLAVRVGHHRGSGGVAEDIDKARLAIKAFEIDYGAKYPKAVAKIVDDADVLLEFYKYPAEHWVHLRTTNPIVILSPANSVVDVRHEVSRSPVLRGGRGYLQSSRKQSLWRDDARSAGYFTSLVA